MMVFLIAYAAGLICQAFVGIMVFSTSPEGDKDRRIGAEVLLASPVWPIYLFKKFIKLIARAVETLKEDKK